MKSIANILVSLVAIEHIWFLVFEMFLWQSNYALETFGMTPQLAKDSAVLAMNQGLYNSFLAAGLFWSFFIKDVTYAYRIKIFFLSCVLLAGIFGGLTAKIMIMFAQGGPALLGLFFVYLSKEKLNRQ